MATKTSLVRCPLLCPFLPQQQDPTFPLPLGISSPWLCLASPPPNPLPLTCRPSPNPMWGVVLQGLKEGALWLPQRHSVFAYRVLYNSRGLELSFQA